jgi:hypothetical protein
MMDKVKSIAQPIVPIRTNGNDKYQAYTFLDSFEKAATANGWKNQLKLHQVGCYLDGDARTWFDTITKSSQSNYTWCELKAAFLQHVCHIEELELDSFIQLFNLKMNPLESLKDYYLRSLQLSTYSTSMPESQLIRLIINGLSLNYQLLLYTVLPKTLVELESLIFRYDEIVARCSGSEEIASPVEIHTDFTDSEFSLFLQDKSLFSDTLVSTRRKKKCMRRKQCMKCKMRGHIAKDCELVMS